MLESGEESDDSATGLSALFQDVLEEYEDVAPLTLRTEPLDVVPTDGAPQLADLSFDMWDTTHVRNIKKVVRKSRRLLALRVELLRRVVGFLERLADVNWCVYGGTALSVLRENGRFIAHDYDTDLALDEAHFARVWHALSQLTEDDEFLAPRLVYWHAGCPFNRVPWMVPQADGSVKETVFQLTARSQVKSFKFYLTRDAWQLLDPDFNGKVPTFDRGDVHLDLFTMGQHPTRPDHLICNFAANSSYDPLRHIWPRAVFWPAAVGASFENVSVCTPRDLEAYLRGEYGYLGRDAIYHRPSQLYVKIPKQLYDDLPQPVRDILVDKDQEDE